MVQEGEIILVTDRDEVIAEIHSPTVIGAGGVSRWQAFLNLQSKKGSVRLAKREPSFIEQLANKGKFWDWNDDYKSSRGSRF